MQRHNVLPLRQLASASAVTVGTFDGVHLGHRALVEELKAAAKVRGLATVVVTFADMPYFHFNSSECSRLLTLPDEKARAFAELDIDDLYIIPFDSQIAEQSAPEFVQEVLIGKLGLRLFVAGPDFALGKGRQGDIPALEGLGRDFSYDVQVLHGKIDDEGQPISSTRIRNCVESGDVKTAARLLGRPFDFSGEVVSGQQLGRKIGFPTINIRPHPRKVLPAHGVYAARAFFEGDAAVHRAALNIGMRPTVDGTSETVEFHVVGETVDHAPETVRLEVVERLREERRFPSLDALTEQLREDVQHSARLLSK